VKPTYFAIKDGRTPILCFSVHWKQKVSASVTGKLVAGVTGGER